MERLQRIALIPLTVYLQLINAKCESQVMLSQFEDNILKNYNAYSIKMHQHKVHFFANKFIGRILMHSANANASFRKYANA